VSILDRLRGRSESDLDAALRGLRRRSRDPRADVLTFWERVGGTDALMRQLSERNVHPRVVYTLLGVHRQARLGTPPMDSRARAALESLRIHLRINYEPAGGLTELDAGIAELADGDRDPREAFSAAWHRLHQLATARGIEGRPGDRPGDQIRRLLESLSLDPMPLSALLEVQQRRYEPVDEEFRWQARSALEWMRAELTGVVTP
jgi:hypothetical protein